MFSYYATFKDLEIMFHVSTELPLQTRTDELGQQVPPIRQSLAAHLTQVA